MCCYICAKVFRQFEMSKPVKFCDDIRDVCLDCIEKEFPCANKKECVGAVPTGEEFIKLSPERQRFWIKFILSNRSDFEQTIALRNTFL